MSAICPDCGGIYPTKPIEVLAGTPCRCVRTVLTKEQNAWVVRFSGLFWEPAMLAEAHNGECSFEDMMGQAIMSVKLALSEVQ